jgi:ATP-binding cassette, subfamily F, member 3
MDISVQHIKKNFGVYHILEDVNFLVNTGDKIGIVGVNGSGKSTLFRIIAGLETSDGGEIVKRKGITVSYLDQIPQYEGTVEQVLLEAFTDLIRKKQELEEVAHQLNEHNEKMLKIFGAKQEEFERLGGYEMDTRLQKVIKGLRIEDDWLQREFESLSGGERSRVMLAKLLLEEPDVLLLDEPTNHLDLQSIEWLETYLSKLNTSVLVISHDRYLLDRFAKKIVNVEQGKSRVYQGNYSTFIQEKALYMESLWNEYQAQNKMIKRMEDQIERYRIWGRMRDSEKMYKRAKELEHRLERVERLDKPFEQKNIKLRLQASERTGKEVLTLNDVSKSYDEIILSEVNLTVYFQDRAFLIGPNGAGKTTLFSCIFNETDFLGTIKLGSKVQIGTIPQDIIYPPGAGRILDEYRSRIAASETEARTKLAQFLFFGEDVFKNVTTLSGGEKTRLELCILVNSSSNLLLLDEPTNHLDIESKELLETALLEYQGTLLIISHDRYFINKLADYLYVFEEKSVRYFNGNYEDYSKYITATTSQKEPPKKVVKVKKEKQVEVLNYEELITKIDEQIANELKQEEPNFNLIGEWIAQKEVLETEWLEHMKKVS